MPKSNKHNIPSPASVVMTGYHLKRAREYGAKAAEHLRQAHECTYEAETDLLALDDVDFYHMEPEKGRRLIGDAISGSHFAGEAHEFFRRFIVRLGVKQPTDEQLIELGGGGGR